MNAKTTDPQTSAELEAALRDYIGTEHYYTSPTFGVRGFRYTDGVRKMAELAGAFWLLCEIHAAAADNPQFKAGFWTVHMESRNTKGKLRISFDFRDDGTPINMHGELNADFTKEIPFTDFPEGAFEFYLQDGIMLLKSEW